MTHLIFTHGRWHRFEPYSPDHNPTGLVKEEKKPKPFDTFTELTSPLSAALQDVRQRGLDAHVAYDKVWRIKRSTFVSETLTCGGCGLQYVTTIDGWFPDYCPACATGEKMVLVKGETQ